MKDAKDGNVSFVREILMVDLFLISLAKMESFRLK